LRVEKRGVQLACALMIHRKAMCWCANISTDWRLRSLFRLRRLCWRRSWGMRSLSAIGAIRIQVLCIQKRRDGPGFSGCGKPMAGRRARSLRSIANLAPIRDRLTAYCGAGPRTTWTKSPMRNCLENAAFTSPAFSSMYLFAAFIGSSSGRPI